MVFVQIYKQFTEGKKLQNTPRSDSANWLQISQMGLLKRGCFSCCHYVICL